MAMWITCQLSIFGIAEDENGDYTKVWSSKETKFTKDGCSPAEEFFASSEAMASLLASKVYAPAAASSMLSVEQQALQL